MTRRERRQHLRFRADWEADFQITGVSVVTGQAPLDKSLTGQARVEDVSRTGMRVALPKPLRRGTKVLFTVRLPGETAPVAVVGEVVWAAPGAQLSGAGIRFQEIKPLDLARMLDYLYARWLGG